MSGTRVLNAFGFVAAATCSCCCGAHKTVPVEKPLAPVACTVAAEKLPPIPEPVTPAWVASTRAKIFTHARPQQSEEWQRWSFDSRVGALQAEALRQLSWARDKRAIRRSMKALGSPEPIVRTTAARVLTTSGPNDAPLARAALHAAAATANEALLPAFVWALVELSDPSIFEQALDLHRQGDFDSVMALDGTSAFSLERLARLASPQRLLALSSAPEPALRQVGAYGLSRNAVPAHTDILVRLVGDEDVSVACEAAHGLVTLGTPVALEALHQELRRANKERYQSFLESLRDNHGIVGLTTALQAVTPEIEKTQLGQNRLTAIFNMMSAWESVAGQYGPTANQVLYDWLRSPHHPHWQTRAALMLTQMGDNRALPFLARRLRQDPVQLYGGDDNFDAQLRRDDSERVTAARLIGDLAEIRPNDIDDMRSWVEDALIYWMHHTPVPHANAMRALANLRSTKDIKSLRAWAHPRVALPHEGDQPPMPEEWIIAGVAERYVGRLKDEPSFPVLIGALKRRPEKVDVSMDSLLRGGLAILGMSLRALGMGAAQGLAEWGDSRAFEPLLAYAENPLENEHSRVAACAALPWVASRSDYSKIVELVLKHTSQDKRDVFTRSCLLEALISRPYPNMTEALSPLLLTDTPIEIRQQVARVIGRAGFTRELETSLLASLNEHEPSLEVALTLMLGGSPEAAARAVAMVARSGSPSAIEELSELWFRSFGYWGEEDLHERLFRWIANAEAIGRVAGDKGLFDFAQVQLRRQLDDLFFDSGPHSLTRNLLRARLYEAQGWNQHEAARNALEFVYGQRMKRLSARGASEKTP